VPVIHGGTRLTFRVLGAGPWGAPQLRDRAGSITTMQFGILGPLEVADGDSLHPLADAKQRAGRGCAHGRRRRALPSWKLVTIGQRPSARENEWMRATWRPDRQLERYLADEVDESGAT
jgi:hypothetical protein